MSDVESSDEGFQMERRVSQAETEIIDPFAIATKKKVSYGTFASMGLNPGLQSSLKKKGYSNPTPIQRRVIPIVLSGSDVIAMARTGSGKTLAFTVPLLERLGAHSFASGVRALVLAPTRELCMQTYKYVKQLSSGSDLRVALLTGGDQLEHHFEMLSANPDIIVAAPGRLLHLIHETGLSLGRLEMLVFDEADRLLEMGFQTEIEAIVRETPTTRQTLLFSATLPKVLAEFTKVGLRNPEMVRLDADSQLSENLFVAHFTVRQEEKTAALLLLLNHLLKSEKSSQQKVIDKAEQESKAKAALESKETSKKNTSSSNKSSSKGKKSSSKKDDSDDSDNEGENDHSKPSSSSGASHKSSSSSSAMKQCIVFAASRHHVEYLQEILTQASFSVTSIYGQMDSSARKINLAKFTKKRAQVLIVTDVAARGIDIPQLDFVINYDFPDKAKLFVHRVGRTARAGKSGAAFSLLQPDELPYLLDLQLFLNSSQLLSTLDGRANCVHGRMPRRLLEENVEEVTKLHSRFFVLNTLALSMSNATNLYKKTRKVPSRASVLRAKSMTDENGVMKLDLHPEFLEFEEANDSAIHQFLQEQLRAFRPAQNIFEIRNPKSGKENPIAGLMQLQRNKFSHIITKTRNEKREARLADVELEDLQKEESARANNNKLEEDDGAAALSGDESNKRSVITLGSKSRLEIDRALKRRMLGLDSASEDEDDDGDDDDDEIILEEQVSDSDEEEMASSKKRKRQSSPDEEDLNESDEEGMDIDEEDDEENGITLQNGKPSSSSSASASASAPSASTSASSIDRALSSGTAAPKAKKSKHAPQKKKTFSGAEASWRDEKFFMSGISSSSATDRGLAIKEAPKTIEDMVLDLNPDDDRSIFRKKSLMTWDKRKKKFVATQDTENGKKELRVRNESGQLIIVGDKNRGKLYRQWSEKSHKSIPSLGEIEDESTAQVGKKKKRRSGEEYEEEKSAPVGFGPGGASHDGPMLTPSRYRYNSGSHGSSKPDGVKSAREIQANLKGRHGGKREVKSEIKSRDELKKNKAEEAKKQFLQSKNKRPGGRGGGGGGKRR